MSTDMCSSQEVWKIIKVEVCRSGAECRSCSISQDQKNHGNQSLWLHHNWTIWSLIARFILIRRSFKGISRFTESS
ncbi:hypothetical protein SLE2022_332960 [Rubroshorea leprosula]